MIQKEKLFQEIIEDNQERIFRICCYYSKDAEERKDLFQEMLINIWSSLKNFKGESALGTWIYRVSVNTALNFVKKELRYNQHFEKLDIIQSDKYLKYEDDSYNKEFEEKLNILLSQINQLSVIDKVIISLHLEGLSGKEIAEVVGVTEPNIRVKIHRIKSQLKEELKGIII